MLDQCIAPLNVTVRSAGPRDIPAWLALVDSVADGFPGLDMTDYTETLKKNVVRGTALCAGLDEKIVGVLLFSPCHHCLSCMAVHSEYRRRGIAAALISEMLRRMPEGDISVTTFCANDPKGTAPRALYQKFGFVPEECLFEFNCPVQRFVLHRK